MLCYSNWTDNNIKLTINHAVPAGNGQTSQTLISDLNIIFSPKLIHLLLFKLVCCLLSHIR